MKCKNCKSKKLKKILHLGSQPISSVFHNKKKNNLKKYPLNLFKCRSCDLIQFSKLAPLKDMYGSTYGYRTSLSKYMINHMKEKYLKLNKESFLKKNSSILTFYLKDLNSLNI